MGLPAVMALLGQTGTQASQPIHSSLIKRAILSSFHQIWLKFSGPKMRLKILLHYLSLVLVHMHLLIAVLHEVEHVLRMGTQKRVGLKDAGGPLIVPAEFSFNAVLVVHLLT